ncbi:MAG: dTDP-4-dehydrorhamnose 3,5-epimerase [Holosporaceae bacterium]|nr:dTDP-4-dehydrorhamnose 3,5-epimerase [Holosporaceae bacterium]
MNVLETEIKDLYIIEPKFFGDSRGYFFESYNKYKFEANELKYDFIQDNQSMSRQGTIRGLHFQFGKYAQTKLIYVSFGTVQDVAVDLRSNSPSFGKHLSVVLSGENRRRFLIPKGFAHGFAVLSEYAIFHYKCDNPWHRESERGIRFDDPDLNIDWRLNHDQFFLSEKDKVLPLFRDFQECF